MRLIYGLVVWFLLTPAVFASTPQKNATPADALVHEARLLWNRGERKQAVEKVRQAVAIDPARSHVQIELASMYLQLGERSKALGEIDAAVKQDAKPYALSRFLNASDQGGQLRTLRCAG